MKKLNQKGFSPFEVALLILVLAALGFAGFTVYQKNRPEDQSQTSIEKQSTRTPIEKQSAEQQIDEYAGWKEEINNKYKFSYKYPASSGKLTWTTFVSENPESSQGYKLGDYVNAAGVGLAISDVRGTGFQPFTFSIDKVGTVEDLGGSWEQKVDPNYYTQKSKTTVTKNNISGTRWEYKSLKEGNSDFIRYRYIKGDLSYFMLIEGVADGINLLEHGEKIHKSFTFL